MICSNILKMKRMSYGLCNDDIIDLQIITKNLYSALCHYYNDLMSDNFELVSKMVIVIITLSITISYF